MAKKGIKSNVVGKKKSDVEKLTDIQKVIIKLGSTLLSAEELSSCIRGVSKETIEEFIKAQKVAEDPIKELLASITDDEEHRKMTLALSGKKAGDLMGRNKINGVTVMTEGASEMADAKKVHAVPEITEDQKRRRKDYIHKPLEG